MERLDGVCDCADREEEAEGGSGGTRALRTASDSGVSPFRVGFKVTLGGHAVDLVASPDRREKGLKAAEVEVDGTGCLSERR